MKLIDCRVCNEKVAPHAKVCPSCGTKTPNIKAYKLRFLLYAIAAFVGAVVEIRAALIGSEVDMVNIAFGGGFTILFLVCFYYFSTGKDTSL